MGTEQTLRRNQEAARYALLTDAAIAEARSVVGVPLRRRVRYRTASRDLLLRYAKALGCRNPLYTDMTHGLLNTQWAALLAHPTAVFLFDSTVVAPKLPGIHTLYGGVTLEWARQIRPGDRIEATAKLIGVEEIEGDFCGPMVRQTGEVRYANQDGDLVAMAWPRILRTPRDAARRRQKYGTLERYKYTRREIEAILVGYEAETIRGTAPLYFEDVEVGSHLPKVVKGPLTTEDMNFFVGEVFETLFYRDFVAHMRRHPADVYWHPETNMPDSWDASLLLDDVAREFGFPCAHDTGLQRVAWLECLVTNWMGDLAMLRRLDVRLDRPFLHADTAWLSGEISAKRLLDGMPVVEVVVRCEDQRGELSAHGSAEVWLPSRSFDAQQPGLIGDSDFALIRKGDDDAGASAPGTATDA